MSRTFDVEYSVGSGSVIKVRVSASAPNKREIAHILANREDVECSDPDLIQVRSIKSPPFFISS